MAKKTSRGSSSLNTSAENIGAALGHVAARLDAWKKQRAEIASDIHKVLQSAQALLGEIGVVGKGVDISPSIGKRNGGRPKGYKMSAATKRKLREAWKRRKAEAKLKVKEVE